MTSTELKTTHTIFDGTRDVPSERIQNKMKETVRESFNSQTGEIKKTYTTVGFCKLDPKELADRMCFDSKAVIFLKLSVLMQKSNNEISGSYAVIAKKVGCKEHATRNAITELLKADVLRRMGQSRYMINPAIICHVDGEKRRYLDCNYRSLPFYTAKNN